MVVGGGHWFGMLDGILGLIGGLSLLSPPPFTWLVKLEYTSTTPCTDLFFRVGAYDCLHVLVELPIVMAAPSQVDGSMSVCICKSVSQSVSQACR